MGRIMLPKKIQNWTIVKLFTLSVFIFSVYYFYPTFKKDNFASSEVLQAQTQNTATLYQIDSYIMKDVIKPSCDKDQPYFDFFCRVTQVKTTTQGTLTRSFLAAPTFGVNDTTNFNNYLSKSGGQISSTTYQNTGLELYKNPVLEEINGVPILFYYGGIYEVVLDQYPQRVVNITRTYKTVGNKGYTAGCRSSWFPSSVVKKGNIAVFGSGGLEELVENRCYSQEVTSGKDNAPTGFGTTIRGDVDCKNRADLLGIQTLPNCKLSSTSSCWDKSYECQTLNGFTQYYQLPFVTRLTFSKNAKPDTNGSRIVVSGIDGVDRANVSGGAGANDAYTFCLGKTKNDCTAIRAEIVYAGSPKSNVSFCNESICSSDYVGNAKTAVYGSGSLNYKQFYKRVYSRLGVLPSWQDSTDYVSIYGGYDTPYRAYTLARRVDSFQVDDKPWQGGLQYIKYRLEDTVYDGRIASPAPYLLGVENPKITIDSSTGVLADYVSNTYFYKLQYSNNTLRLKRFLVTGYCGREGFGNSPSDEMKEFTCYQLNYVSPKGYFDTTYLSEVVVSNVYLDPLLLKNITFDVNSAEDVDILFAPNFKDSINNIDIKSRMFRARLFNSPSWSNVSPTFYELNSSNGGYSFSNPGPGNNTPLTFKYFNNSDTNTSNDYVVFVSRNYVFSSSQPPASPKCVPNFNLVGGGLNLNNIHPSSINKGIVPTYMDDTLSTYSLNFSFNAAVNLSCPSGTVTIPAGTDMFLKLFDGINSSPLSTVLDAPLGSDRKSFSFTDIDSPNYKKFYYQIYFDYDGNRYYYPGETVKDSINTNNYYTLESFLNVYTYQDSTSTDYFLGPKMVLTKTFRTSQTQGTFSVPDTNYSFALNNSTFDNFFWDHNLTQAGTSLVDEVKYKLCFTNTANTKVSRIGFTGGTSTSTTSISNNNFVATINNGCVDLNYKSTNVSSYNIIPQEMDVYLSGSTLSVPSTYINFRVNGNLMIKNSANIKMYSKSSANQKYQGIYISNGSASSSLTGSKTANLNNTLLSTYFKIPYFTGLTKAYNFSYTEDLVNYSQPTTNLLYLLLSDTKTQGPSGNFTKIDVLASMPQSYTPTIIYVAKNKQLLFDLNNINLSALMGKVYFVSTDSINTKDRIIFKVDCNNTNYSTICSSNSNFNLYGGLYGDFKVVGNLNSLNSSRQFITINEDPGLLIELQKDLRVSKVFNVTRSKTIFKYLNN